jgi:hypothetical protein
MARVVALGGGSATQNISNAYSGSLKTYSDAAKQVLSKLTEAETGYGSLLSTYAPGGSYGAGQKALVQKNAAQSLAASQIGAVGSGMSSSTNAAGLATQIRRGAAQQELGIEDARDDKFAAVMQGLSALKAGSAGTMAGMAANAPSYAPYASTMANIYGTDVGSATAKYTASLGAQTSMSNAQLASQTQLALGQQRANASSSGGGGLEEDWL